MARINIEDSIYRDERFHKLSAFEGYYKALGLCVAAWDLAHRWFNKHPENLVPFSAWDEKNELSLLEKYGLAERRENGIYVKGSKDECNYLTKRSEAGRRGALKSNEIQSSKRQQSQQKPPSSSVSISISSSVSKKNTYLQEIKLAWDVWTNTLKSFNVPESRISPQQESSIARAIKTIGFENVIDALEGARYEPRTQTFDPSKVLRIDRVLHRDAKGVSRWEQFANLARQARQKAEQETNRATDLKNKALGIES